MRTFKFRYTQSGATKFKELELPDDAVILRGHDYDGREIYEGDEICGQDLKTGRVHFIDKPVLKHFALISPLDQERDKNFFLAWLNRRQEEVDPLCLRFNSDPATRLEALGKLALL